MKLLFRGSLAPALAALAALLLLPPAPVTASTATAGAPEHLIARGGECVRLFHTGGGIGCRTVSRAEMAALVPIETQDELDEWLAGSQGKDDKRALVLPEHLLTTDLLDSAKDRLSGVYVFPTAAQNVSFAAQTPQGRGTVDEALNPFADAKTAWNPTGHALIPRELPFPVVMLADAELGDTYMARARTNIKANAGATYTAFMNYYYGPETMDSTKCLSFTNIYGNRSPKCDPIGGQSTWGRRGPSDARETVLVMTGMDAYALSQVLTPGANEAVAGVVALLAAAQALRAVPDASLRRQVVFAAFQGEKFGFVGSRRFLADLTAAQADKDGFCRAKVDKSTSPFGQSLCTSPLLPSLAFADLDLDSITHAIAVDQVGRLAKRSSGSGSSSSSGSGSLYVHINPNAPSDEAATLVDALVKAPSAQSGAIGVAPSSVDDSLPPSPLLSFVNDKEYGKGKLVGAVLAGYDAAFVDDGSYASRHDVLETLDTEAVVQAAQVLAEAVYQLATKSSSEDGSAADGSAADGSEVSKIKVDKELVTDLLSCLATNWNCELMKKYSTPFVETMIDSLSLVSGAWPVSQYPITLYSGPMNDDRQSLVLTLSSEDDDATASYSADTTAPWADATNRIHLFPNAYEVFTHGFLAAALADADATTSKKCTKTQDCRDGDKPNDLECVAPGVCATRHAFFHDAFSPGLNRTARPQIYEVVDDSLPIWTEPTWNSDVGSYVFPNPGESIGWIVLAIGVVIAGVGYVGSRWLLTSVEKMKLL